jgi:membrane fusion protein, heavy metal efflux system
MKRTLSIGASVLVGLALGVVLDGWGGKRHAAVGATARAKSVPDERTVELSPELVKRAQIELGEARNEQLAPTLRLVGSINFNAEHLAEVGARIDGRVARLLVSVGDEVKQGQPLVEIDSAELGEAAAELLAIQANLIAAEHSEKRESQLLAQQLSSAPVVERVRAEVRALRAQLNGAEQRLLTMGFSPESIEELRRGDGPRRITLRSPIAGEVVQRDAVIGQVVTPTQTIVRVADLSQLWVELDVFERDLGRVAPGNHVAIESETHPGKVFQGRVTYVEATVDMVTRTAHVRVEVDNHERRLRPGQFVQARLSTSGSERSVLSVPRSAVLQVEGEPSVFTATENGRYVARPVELGAVAGDRVEIVRGLVAGDRVVTKGAFALKSEMLR